MKTKSVLLGLLLAVLHGPLANAESSMEAVQQALKGLVEDESQIGSIAESPMPGVYEVEFRGHNYYVHTQGEYILIGRLYDYVRGIDLATAKSDTALHEYVVATPVADMVVMKPDEMKRYLTVFTDIDCGYCQLFHSEVPMLTQAGVEVRYLAYPRSGIGTSSYDKLVSVWCATDPPEAMTLAKAGNSIEDAICPNPVAQQYEGGQAAGISGTPTLILDDGTVIRGYVPSDRLLEMLDVAG